MSEAEEKAKDASYALTELVVALIAALCAPQGWGVTVFLALIMISPNRRVQVRP